MNAHDHKTSNSSSMDEDDKFNDSSSSSIGGDKTIDYSGDKYYDELKDFDKTDDLISIITSIIALFWMTLVFYIVRIYKLDIII